MKKILTFSLIIIGSIIGAQNASALSTPSTASNSDVYITSINATSAQVSVYLRSDDVASAARNRQQIKIQWRPWMCGDDQIAGQACTMMYIQPFVTTLDYDSSGNLLPVVLTNLQPNTKYRVWLGYDNGVRCITTPCSPDTFQTNIYSFTTLGKGVVSDPVTTHLLTQKLRLGSRGTEVNILENFLSDNGYFVGTGGDMRKYVDSFFGTVTKSAVIKFQSDHELKADGIVGAGTRTVINQQLAHQKETQ